MSIVRHNLMNSPGYAPYCGRDRCFNRTRFNGVQFKCPCGWRSEFEPEFIAAYQARWASQEQDEEQRP